jgi:hypothetical protein
MLSAVGKPLSTLGKPLSLVGRLLSVIGKATILVGKPLSVIGKPLSTVGNTLSLVGRQMSTLENNQFLVVIPSHQKKNATPLVQEYKRFIKHSSLSFGNTSPFIEKPSSVVETTSFLKQKRSLVNH